MARPNRRIAYAYLLLPLIFLKSKLELVDSTVTVTVRFFRFLQYRQHLRGIRKRGWKRT
jgi:hypothetical protein